MRSQLGHRAKIGHNIKLVALPVLALVLVLGAGCGSDSGSEPEPTPECAISGVNTTNEDSWLTGESVSIRWTQNGIPGTVVIELLKSGDVVATIAQDVANRGFFPWTATTGGQANGADFGIRVSGTGTSSCTDEINGLTIIDVTDCNIAFAALDDTINAGETIDITWTGDHTSGLVDIELWTAAFGAQVDELVGFIGLAVPDVGSYTWLVDSFNNANEDVYRYVIRDVQVADCEAVSEQVTIFDDNICSITVIGPTGGQVFNRNDNLRLDFIQTNGSGSGTVDLRLFAGNVQVPNGDFAKNISVIEPYFWSVEDFGFTMSNSAYNIRAFDTVDGYCTGESERFTILP